MKRNSVLPIKVWRFDEAPKEYSQEFASDDADWLAFVPDYYGQEYILWLSTPYFGACEVKSKEVWGGFVYAGYHA